MLTLGSLGLAASSPYTSSWLWGSVSLCQSPACPYQKGDSLSQRGLIWLLTRAAKGAQVGGLGS